MYAQSRHGRGAGDLAPGEAIVQAAQRAARRSPRLLLVYLDQIEQLLYPTRPTAEVDAFFESMATLVDLPLRNARVALSLREDYLGRFRDRLRGRGRLLENGFRVGMLTVGELREAVCQAAAAGEPPQTWSPDQMRELMLQVRAPGEAPTEAAEAQAAYAQIVCRALFQERAQGEEGEAEVAVEAELILHRYLDMTLEDLGPLAPDARRLLADHLVTATAAGRCAPRRSCCGSCRWRGSGRSWRRSSARPSCTRRRTRAAATSRSGTTGSRGRSTSSGLLREREEEDRRRAEAQAREMREQRVEAEARLAKARGQRRFLAGVALVSIVVALGAAGMCAWALRQQEAANDAKAEAEAK